MAGHNEVSGLYPGISTQIFRGEKLTAEHVKAIAASDFAAAEIYGMSPHFDCSDETLVRNAAGWFADEGIRVASVHAPIAEMMSGTRPRRGISISLGNSKRRARTLDSIFRTVDAANTLGAKIVVVHFGMFGDFLKGEVLSNIVSSLILIDDRIKGSGVAIAFENVATQISMAGYMTYLLEQYAFNRMGVCLDIGHANINEEPSFAVESCARKLIHIHASDNNGTADDHLYPLEGGIKWKLVMKNLRRIDYDGCFVFEPRKDASYREILEHCRVTYDLLLELREETDVGCADA